jgi:hypothetical protein
MDVAPVLKIPGLAGNLTTQVGTGQKLPGTELPADQVVVAAIEAESLDGTTPRRARRALSLSDVTERQVTIDPETREIVHQSIDTRSGEVVAQYPDRALLGMRAYFDRLAEQRAAKASTVQAEREPTLI